MFSKVGRRRFECTSWDFHWEVRGKLWNTSVRRKFQSNALGYKRLPLH